MSSGHLFNFLDTPEHVDFLSLQDIPLKLVHQWNSFVSRREVLCFCAGDWPGLIQTTFQISL